MPKPLAPIDAPADYDPFAIYDSNGPINPIQMTEAMRVMMRALPLEGDEPTTWRSRRMYAAMTSLAALHPRDEIEVMIGVQALSAYHAAAACWYLGMNHHSPHGDSTRHFSAAANAARTFDTLLKALERRQARPLAVPPGRPPSRDWDRPDVAAVIAAWSDRCAGGQTPQETLPTWDGPALFTATTMLDLDRIAQQNEGLDIANTDGIRPDGSIIVPLNPTPQQVAYIARRLGLGYREKWADNQRRGIHTLPKIVPIRPGDLVP